MNIDKFWNWSHKTHIETFVWNVTLLDCIKGWLCFRWVKFLVFFIKIRNYVLDCTFLRLGNLSNQGQRTLGRLAINSSLIFLSSGLSSRGSRMDCSSSKRVSILILEYWIFNREYLLSFHIDDHISNHFPFKSFSCDTGDVQNSCAKGMSLNTFIFKVFNE